eukprot:1139009-Pelagomonas_calceolata.AAC.5
MALYVGIPQRKQPETAKHGCTPACTLIIPCKYRSCPWTEARAASAQEGTSTALPVRPAAA